MTSYPVTIITGGSSGIGAATTRRLLERGHYVTITGRDRERLDATAKELGNPPRLRTFTGDASDYDSVKSVVDRTVHEFGQLDVVIANAGFATASHSDPPGGYGDLTDSDPASWRDMVLTNVLGPALLINSALPLLKQTRGRIVLIGSVAGIIFTPGNIYGATKWAVTGLAENTRRKVTADGVGVTLIVPGLVETPFRETHGGNFPECNLAVSQVAECIAWAISQPDDVDVNTVVVRPKGQAV
jgi:NADP-dependent 3-hydroxy acid dehydrogenase YdfG